MSAEREIGVDEHRALASPRSRANLEAVMAAETDNLVPGMGSSTEVNVAVPESFGPDELSMTKLQQRHAQADACPLSADAIPLTTVPGVPLESQPNYPVSVPVRPTTACATTVNRVAATQQAESWLHASGGGTKQQPRPRARSAKQDIHAWASRSLPLPRPEPPLLDLWVHGHCTVAAELRWCHWNAGLVASTQHATALPQSTAKQRREVGSAQDTRARDGPAGGPPLAAEPAGKILAPAEDVPVCVPQGSPHSHGPWPGWITAACLGNAALGPDGKQAGWQLHDVSTAAPLQPAVQANALGGSPPRIGSCAFTPVCIQSSKGATADVHSGQAEPRIGSARTRLPPRRAFEHRRLGVMLQQLPLHYQAERRGTRAQSANASARQQVADCPGPRKPIFPSFCSHTAGDAPCQRKGSGRQGCARCGSTGQDMLLAAVLQDRAGLTRDIAIPPVPIAPIAGV